jgi:hypothetical protein
MTYIDNVKDLRAGDFATFTRGRDRVEVTVSSVEETYHGHPGLVVHTASDLLLEVYGDGSESWQFEGADRPLAITDEHIGKAGVATVRTEDDILLTDVRGYVYRGLTSKNPGLRFITITGVDTTIDRIESFEPDTREA